MCCGALVQYRKGMNGVVNAIGMYGGIGLSVFLVALRCSTFHTARRWDSIDISVA